MNNLALHQRPIGVPPVAEYASVLLRTSAHESALHKSTRRAVGRADAAARRVKVKVKVKVNVDLYSASS